MWPDSSSLDQRTVIHTTSNVRIASREWSEGRGNVQQRKKFPSFVCADSTSASTLFPALQRAPAPMHRAKPFSGAHPTAPFARIPFAFDACGRGGGSLI